MFICTTIDGFFLTLLMNESIFSSCGSFSMLLLANATSS